MGRGREGTNRTERTNGADVKTTLMMQLELFTTLDERKPLLDYWRECLKAWPAKVREYRHYRNTTGWSMATGGFSFARRLFRAGKITRKDFKRWWKFHRRVRRWNEKAQQPRERQ